MNVVIGVVLGALLLVIVEARHQTIAASASLRVGSQPIAYPNDPSGQLQVGSSMVDNLSGQAIGGISVAANALKSVSKAIPFVGEAIAAVADVFLAAHTERLHDAQTENARVTELIPKWDRDFVDIVARYSAGQVNLDQAIAGVQKLDGQAKTYLRGLVGKPGTAWSGAPTGCPGQDVDHSWCLDGGQSGSCSGPHNCNKSCTVGCCIYYNYLEPAADCLIKRLQMGGVRNVGRAAIPGNKYGFPNFPNFTVQIVPPYYGG